MDYVDVNLVVVCNYIWYVFKKLVFFNLGGIFDCELVEYVMMLIGMVIYVLFKDDELGKFVLFVGDVFFMLVIVLFDGI